MTDTTSPWGFPYLDPEADRPTGNTYLQQTIDLVEGYKPGRSVDLYSQLGTITNPTAGDRVWVNERKEWYVYRTSRLHYGTAGWEPWTQITKVFGGTHLGSPLGDPDNGAQIIVGTAVINPSAAAPTVRVNFSNGGFTTRVLSIILSNGQANKNSAHPALWDFNPADLTGFYATAYYIDAAGTDGTKYPTSSLRLQYLAVGV